MLDGLEIFFNLLTFAYCLIMFSEQAHRREDCAWKGMNFDDFSLNEFYFLLSFLHWSPSSDYASEDVNHVLATVNVKRLLPSQWMHSFEQQALTPYPIRI
jgi:hypothetical protein